MIRRRVVLAGLVTLTLIGTGCGRARLQPLEVTASNVAPGEASSLVVNGVRFFAGADTRIELVYVATAGETSWEVTIDGRRLSITTDGVLRLGSHGYGLVEAGDEVRIEDRQLLVNGEQRGRVVADD